MLKFTKAVLSATLACSLVPAPAFALPVMSNPAVRAGLDQQVGSLRIREAGTYVLTGNLRGTVLVDPGAGDVTLVMDNVVIDGNGGPAIEALSGNRLTIMVPEGTNNCAMSSMSSPESVGTIMSSVNTDFQGRGLLTVIGDTQAAVRTNNAHLTFGGGNYQIISGGCGVAVEGTNPGVFNMAGGSIDFRVAQGAISANTAYAYSGGQIQEPGFDASFAYGTYVSEHPWVEPMMSGGNQGQQSTSSGQGQLPAPGQGQQAGAPGQGQAPDSSGQGQMPAAPGQTTLTGTTDTSGEIVQGVTTNSAADLEADMDNATYYVMTDDENQVKITSSGTYVVSGTSTDGNIVVKKGTTGVVLVLDDLDLTSTTGAALSVNKEAEVKIIVSGDVVLTDNENPDDEYSTDEAVADAYDGAALKVKANSQVYITGDGTLDINGNAKNGIKAGDDSSLIIDGTTINISAVNDGINANYDLTILSGDVTIEAGDDAIHADHILTIGDYETGEGPTVDITNSTEGIEGTVVNLFGGDVNVTSTDDAINAANKDGVYEGELEYSVNMTGGDLTVVSGGDGIDSNGNVNLVGGTAEIRSSSVGGEAGIDYDGEFYVSDEFELNNNSGVAGPDGVPGQMGGMGQQTGQFGDMGQQTGQFGDMDQQPGSGQFGGMDQQPGQFGGMGQMNQASQMSQGGQMGFGGMEGPGRW